MTEDQKTCVKHINAQLAKLHTEHKSLCAVNKNKSEKEKNQQKPIQVEDLMTKFNLTNAEANQCINVAFGFAI